MNYMMYGGMPQVAAMDSVEQKSEYLKGLFTHVYLRDIKERYDIQKMTTSKNLSAL